MTEELLKWPTVTCYHCGEKVPNEPGIHHDCPDGSAGFTLLPWPVTREDLEAAGYTVVSLGKKD
jgi:hypothetical protein